MLEGDFNVLKQAKNIADYNPLVPVFKFIGGVIGLILSILWVVHLSIFLLPEVPVNNFLNEYLILWGYKFTQIHHLESMDSFLRADSFLFCLRA